MLRRHHRTLGPSERPPFYPGGGAVEKACNPQSEIEDDIVLGGTGSSLPDVGSSGESREHPREPQTESADEIECLRDNMNSTRTPVATHSSSREPGDRRHRSRRHRRQSEDNDADETKHRRRKTESDVSLRPEKRTHGSVRRKTKENDGLDHNSRLSSKTSSPRKASATARAADSQVGTSSRRGIAGTSKPPRDDAVDPTKRYRDALSRSASTKHHPLPTSTR